MEGRTHSESPSSRDAALARLIESRTEFADRLEERYRSGRRLAEADADRLEQLARSLIGFVDELERIFDRLDAARDLCSYLGADGARVERSRWSRADLAAALVESLEPLLSPTACGVLSSAVGLELAS